MKDALENISILLSLIKYFMPQNGPIVEDVSYLKSIKLVQQV